MSKYIKICILSSNKNQYIPPNLSGFMVKFKTKSGKTVSFPTKDEKKKTKKRRGSMTKATGKSSWKDRVYHSVKRPSAAMLVTVMAIVFTITGWALSTRQQFYTEATNALRAVGINITVTGATIVIGVIALVAVCTFAPNAIGKPVNAFLGRWGLRL